MTLQVLGGSLLIALMAGTPANSGQDVTAPVSLAKSLAATNFTKGLRPVAWADARTVGPFVCRADFSLDDLSADLDRLAQLQTDLIRALEIPPNREKIEIYLFHDKDTYARYLSRHLPTIPYRRAMYVKGRGPGRVFAYRSDAFEVDLRHECTHALLHGCLASLPMWLDEGLAEYFEVRPQERVAAGRHHSAVRRNADEGIVPDLKMLDRKTQVREMGRNEYRDAWAWTHFMLHGPAAAHEELIDYLKDCRRGEPEVPMGGRLIQRLPELNALFLAHFSEHSPTAE